MKSFYLFLFLIVSIEETEEVSRQPFIVEPNRAIINSSDEFAVIFCTSTKSNFIKNSTMTVSLDAEEEGRPAFRWKTENINETTIRIFIEPNGFVGVRRIVCHWKDKIESGSRIDLIFRDRIGNIRLKENCREFDRLYVECQFIAPFIAQALKNRASPIFHFIDLDRRFSGYANRAQLIPAEAENEIAFRFPPLPRTPLAVKPILPINMTVFLFNSMFYTFSINAVRTTRVNFTLNEIGADQMTLIITKNQSNPTLERRCFVRISQIHNTSKLVLFNDIGPVVGEKLILRHLKSNTKHEICVRCFYDEEDESSRENHCQMATTKKKIYFSKFWWIFLLFPFSVIIIGIQRKLKSKRNSRSSFRKEPSVASEEANDEPDIGQDEDGSIDDQTEISKQYIPLTIDSMNIRELVDNDVRIMSPDTINLREVIRR